jgi:chromosome segregation ATPase
MSTPELTISQIVGNEDDEWLTQSQIKQMSEEITSKVKSELEPVIETLRAENTSLQERIELRKKAYNSLKAHSELLESTIKNQAGVIVATRDKAREIERENVLLQEELRALKSRQISAPLQIPLSLQPQAISPSPSPSSSPEINSDSHLLKAFERAEHARRHSRQKD